MSNTAKIINFPVGELILSGKYASGIPIEALSELSGAELKLYIALCSYANKENKCYPKRKDLAAIIYKGDWDKITATKQENRLNIISKHLKVLVNKKWLEIIGDGRYGKPNDYIVKYRSTPIKNLQGVKNSQGVNKVEGHPTQKTQGHPVKKVEGQATIPLQPTITDNHIVNKSELFKLFFKTYPEHRRGGTNAQAWKVWKSENLTDRDAELALNWLQQAAASNRDWETSGFGQYVQGITKFIRERIWLTPVPVTKNQTIDEWDHVRNDTSWADNLDITGAES